MINRLARFGRAAACAVSALVFVAAGVSVASAQTPTPPAPGEARTVLRGDRFVFGDDFTLRTGETLRGDLTVFGGTAMMEEGSRVEGDVSVVGGNVSIAGEVTGDLTVLGGNAHLLATARVDGDEAVFSGNVAKDPGAVVRGRTSRAPAAVPTPAPPIPPTAPVVPREFRPSFDLSPLGAIAGIALITVFAMLAVVLFPANTARALDAVREQALFAGVIGASSWVAVPLVLVLLTATICLIPFALVLGVIWGVAVLFGWSVIARMTGGMLMTGFGKTDWTLAGQTAAGAILLAVLGAVPVIGLLIGFVASSVGVGALVLSRFGTRLTSGRTFAV